MIFRLPFIGEVATGKDTTPIESVVEKLVQSEMGAAFLDLSSKGLTNYKTVSERLVGAFNGWVYANVSVLAEEISNMEFELYKVVMRGGVMELEKIEQHEILTLLDRFNPFTTTSQALYLVEAYQELVGDNFIVIDGAGSNVSNLFILRPDKVTVVPGNENDEYTIEKYIYKDTVDGKEVKVTYTPDQIIHIKTPNPDNPYRGKSVVEATAMDIDTDNLAQEMIKMFFKNGATPSVVLTSEQRITKDDIHRLQVDLKRTYGGVRNAFKSMILGNGLKPVSLQQNAKEMQFLEIETAMRDKMMAMFKNTKTSLGITDDVNRANAEASILNWKRSVIKPKMTRIVDAFNEFLVPRYGENLILTFVDPVPENRTEKIDEVKSLKDSEIITLNEARQILGYDEVKGGDTFTTDTSNTDMPEPLKRVSYRKHFRNIGLYNKYSHYKTLYAQARGLAQKSLKKEPEVRLARDFTNEQVTTYQARQINLVNAYEKNFTDSIHGFLDDIEQKAINNLNSVKSIKKKAVELFDYDVEVKNGIDLFTPLQEEIAKLSAKEANVLLNINSAYLPTQNLERTIERNVKRFTKSMLKTDRDELNKILTAGIEQGQSIAQISTSIRDSFANFKKVQTTRIARSEILRASNAGAVDAWHASGVVSGKEWVTDSNPCEYCAPMAGKIIQLDEAYFDKGDSWQGDAKNPIKLDYVTIEEPPLHPNCECTVVPVLKDIRELDYSKETAKLQRKLKKQTKYIAELEKVLEIDDEPTEDSPSKKK